MAIDRDLYQQQWPLPLAIDAKLPQPWYVAGHSRSAVRDVLKNDYGAQQRDAKFTVAGGTMTHICDAQDLRGTRGGTLFVLWGPTWTLPIELERILDVAYERCLRVERLSTRHDVNDNPRQDDPPGGEGRG